MGLEISTELVCKRLTTRFLLSDRSINPWLHAQAVIELVVVVLLLLLMRLHDAYTSSDTFLTVLGYRIGLKPNKNGCNQLLN